MKSAETDEATVRYFSISPRGLMVKLGEREVHVRCVLGRPNLLGNLWETLGRNVFA